MFIILFMDIIILVKFVFYMPARSQEWISMKGKVEQGDLCNIDIYISVSFRNRLISGGLEPSLSHSEKSICNIVLYPVFYEYKNAQS